MKPTRARVTAENLRLGYRGENNQALSIEEMSREYVEPVIPGSGLFYQIGLLHLLAHEMPGEIETDFPVLSETQDLIEGMYATEGFQRPKVFAPKTEATSEVIIPQPKTTRRDKIVVTYSGGKDSLWNLMRAREEVGEENVVAVHIGGLNRSVGAAEKRDAHQQADRLGFALEEVTLKNGAKVKGHNIMRSRDMLLMALSVPYALGFNSSRMVMEGGWTPEGDSEPGGAFNEKYWAWHIFNAALQTWKLPVQTEWQDRGQIDTVTDLAKHWPEALKMVSSCLSPLHARQNTRRRWDKETPDFILENPSQCNACVKCRQIRLAQAYAGHFPEKIHDQIRYFLADTRKWAKAKKKIIADLVGEEFETYLRLAEEKYGVF